ncbi:transglutaminase domain-containing protein [Pseudobutyrivibrio sp. UC1225]|uniref:transglutaminase domain-containing protein n=1 Tax=Pseudobutyrivibrio sp. UC1225 TaxID=1798185 RepID=UPI000B880BA0|nr:transglutaminase domain-containing protein [Pseudobutyrivibrio sp. UC1225]
MKRVVRFLLRTISMLIAATGIFLVASYFIQNYTNKEIDLNPMVDEPVVVESVSYDRYAYQHLNDETKVTYDQIYNCMTEYSEKITVSTKDNSTLQKAYEAVMADYGDLFWVNGYKYNTYTSDDKVVSIEFWPKYTMSKDQRDVYKASIEATADEWLSGISQDASDFKKALYVFETLIENVDYNTDSEENQNILSVFLYRSTVCQGYADAAWYLLDKLGIKSTVITGTANGESHAWNLVYLDGAYYYMDVTWGNSKYLDGNNDTAKRVNYAYFAMTTEEISQNHVITVDFEVPECLSNADNYFVHEGLYYDWFGVDSIGNRLAQSYNNGEAEISLKFSNSDLYSKVINYFIDENHLSDYCRGINSVYYLLDENANVLTIQWVKR